ncbi:hypothetical protein PoB_006319000 [Plakobranchus ocellatus]|uniref:Uncharacterized protein n=1 Tax=Plakobranchus ocellatus TaxID=259542 RepID=A0AAV4CXT3_9GAST|nr:hypothetical protein PoB_006319000 [Plakobranchus ocellatus]
MSPILWSLQGKRLFTRSAQEQRTAKFSCKDEAHAPPVGPSATCHGVAAGIATMANFSALPPEAMATAHFAEKFDQLFNCFNSKALHSKQSDSTAKKLYSQNGGRQEHSRVSMAAAKSTLESAWRPPK